MIRSAVIAVLLAAPAIAQEGRFAEGSEAKSWNLYGEEPALFEARVVDILCELTGDCPTNCGDGARQLGLVRTIDGVLVPVLKNAQAAFNGAVDDLLPYCGQTVQVDGNLVGDDEVNPIRAYHVQRIKGEEADAFAPANRWTKAWAERNPDAAGDGPWFRRDPRVLALIEENGYLGLGPEADAAFIEYYFAE